MGKRVNVSMARAGKLLEGAPNANKARREFVSALRNLSNAKKGEKKHLFISKSRYKGFLFTDGIVFPSDVEKTDMEKGIESVLKEALPVKVYSVRFDGKAARKFLAKASKPKKAKPKKAKKARKAKASKAKPKRKARKAKRKAPR